MIFWGWDLGGVLNKFFPTLRSEGWWFSLLVKSQSWWSKASMQLWREGNHQPHCSFWEAATFSSKCSVGWCKPLSIYKVLKILIEIIFASIFIAFMKAKFFFFFHLYCFRGVSWIWFWQKMQDYLFFSNGYNMFHHKFERPQSFLSDVLLVSRRLEKVMIYSYGYKFHLWGHTALIFFPG